MSSSTESTDSAFDVESSTTEASSVSETSSAPCCVIISFGSMFVSLRNGISFTLNFRSFDSFCVIRKSKMILLCVCKSYDTKVSVVVLQRVAAQQLSKCDEKVNSLFCFFYTEFQKSVRDVDDYFEFSCSFGAGVFPS